MQNGPKHVREEVAVADAVGKGRATVAAVVATVVSDVVADVIAGAVADVVADAVAPEVKGSSPRTSLPDGNTGS